MEIKIDLGSKEVENIVREHVLKNFPIDSVDTEGHEIRVDMPYGRFSIRISEKAKECDGGETND